MRGSNSSGLPAHETPAGAPSGQVGVAGRVDTPAEWRRALSGFTLGILLFETVTGLTIYLLPFSIFNQFAVIVHTVLGVLTLVPVVWYLGQHWLRRYRGAFNHFQLLGYASAGAFVVLVVSGVVLTWQALFSVRISYAWDLVHIWATFVFFALLAAHLLTLVLRRAGKEVNRLVVRRAQVSCLWQSIAWCAAPVLLCLGLAGMYQPMVFDNAFPETYDFQYGIDRPFAPSLARRDMKETEARLVSHVLGTLDAQQGKQFVDDFQVDPNKHVGFATVAEEVCAALELSAAQRSVVSRAVGEAREDFRKRGRVDPRLLGGSAGCGRSGCHSEIYEEWLPSAHRYSSMDFVFQRVQEILVEDRDPQVTRYCAGCHDPISLLAGAKNEGNITLSAEGADEGISCVVCHSIVQTDVRGNADYTIDPPEPYIYELEEGPAAETISGFLLRAYPREHIRIYSRSLYKTTEYCAACHKQFIDEEVNLFGWVQGQNQYDSWRKSRWHTQGVPAETLACRECHMPLIASQDPAAGDVADPGRSPGDGQHRSHRYLAANQFIPLYHDLPGAKKHVELTKKWLRGEYEVPEIAERWTEGPAVRLRLAAPETVRPGDSVEIQTLLTNNKTGHDFPTGPLDMIESWVELTVTDEQGRTVFHTGTLDEREYLVDPQIVFKKEGYDRQGKLIDRHNLWDMVGSRYSRTLYPGFTDTTQFVFPCPGLDAASPFETTEAGKEAGRFKVDTSEQMAGSELLVKAVLWYSKFKAPFLDATFGEKPRLRAPMTAIAEASTRIKVLADGEVPD